MQDWRVIAKFGHEKQALIVLGSSHHQVGDTYQEAFMEVIHPDIRSECTGVVVQKWKGEPMRGKWLDMEVLSLQSINRAIEAQKDKKHTLSH
jgi:hypothetical protein